MQCPKCGGRAMATNSRTSTNAGSLKIEPCTVHRYRTCETCEYRYATIEMDAKVIRELLKLRNTIKGLANALP